jgi:hypothetical protein
VTGWKAEVQGLADLERALGELPKTTGKAVLRRVARKALEPFIARVRQLAPVDDPANTPERAPGRYRDSWIIGSRLNRRQASIAKKEGKSSVEVHAGSTAGSVGIALEFGTTDRIQSSTGRETGRVAAQPHARPAWDATQIEALATVKEMLGPEIEKSAARLAKRRGR